MSYDLLFSYWIFVWFILYYTKVLPYNPKWIFIIAIIYIFIAIIIMIYKKLRPINIFVFFILGIIFKVFPVYLIRNDSTRINDIIFGIILFLFYYAWVYKKGKNEFIKIYTVYIFQFKTPIMKLFS